MRGPWICSDYFKLEGGAGSHTDDGWFDTGDVATIDPEGYMAITDRTKDVIKSGGEWISSIDMENAAVAHPEVLEAAAIGVQHPKWDERPILMVVPQPGKNPDPESVIDLLRPHFAKWQLPDEVLFVDDQLTVAPR